MLVLKNKEFGKKNKGGGKVKPNLSSNKHYTSESKKQAEKELEKVLTKQKEQDANAAKKLVKAVKEADLKNTTKKVVKGAIETAGKNKKALAAATIGTAVVGTGAVAGKKAVEKKRKVFSSIVDENGEEKLFSVKDIAEDTSTAASLGAAGALGYTGVQGAKALHAAKKAAEIANDGKKATVKDIKGQLDIAKKATKEQIEKGSKSGLKLVQTQAKAAKALGKMNKGTKVAASAAAASIVAGGAAKLLGAKKTKKD